MMPEQRDLLVEARDSLHAAKILREAGYHGFAASRAYYTMFYVAEAFLLGKGLAFSKHSGVHAAFAKHFVQTGIAPVEFHRYILRGMEIRQVGDYGKRKKVTIEDLNEQINRAEQFLELAERLIGKITSSE